jgi:gamma-glutamyltranspeptidase/glutathione hydrolase
MIWTRREMLKLTGGLVAVNAVTTRPPLAEAQETVTRGLVSGGPRAAAVGQQVLNEGGNAIDAAVAAALAAAVGAPAACGIGGYGGHMVIALAGGKKITAIDFNSTAPAAAKAEMFPADANGAVRDRINEFGWIAPGVPGTLAGLHLALEKYGTKPFRDVVGPAIQIAREGIPVGEPLNRAITAVLGPIRRDPASAKLLLKDSEPLPVGTIYRNRDLATMLEQLARENAVESFYRGPIGRQIAATFRKHGGLVTAQDLAGYRAREAAPLSLQWHGLTIHTAPLTAGGLTVLQALAILKVMQWDTYGDSPAKTQALVETLRVAWSDRLRLLGDPEKTSVPYERLVSADYTRELAAKVNAATAARKPVRVETKPRLQPGTVHLNSVDRDGNMVAVTLTHGNFFGACVTVDGLGLTLGHGMSRFDVEPDYPNAPGPGKRPLDNMCPVIVSRGSTPVLAVGAAGSRTIVNAVLNVLVQFVALDASLEEAVAAPRIHTEGNLDLTISGALPPRDAELLKEIGYRSSQGFVANLNAIGVDAQTGAARAAQG